MDDLQFDLGDEWFSMMLNDLDTSVFGEENELGDDGVFMVEDVNNNSPARKVLQPDIDQLRKKSTNISCTKAI